MDGFIVFFYSFFTSSANKLFFFSFFFFSGSESEPEFELFSWTKISFFTGIIKVFSTSSNSGDPNNKILLSSKELGSLKAV